MGVVLLAGSIGLAVRDRSEKRLAVQHELLNKVDAESTQLEEYFERARSINLLTAQNPAFRDVYAKPSRRLELVKAHGRAIQRSEAALAYLEELYPASIGEACFIDRGGAENARYVRGVRAPFADLSPDESGNPFFAPSFALRPGEVYQAEPYISPDTGEWVIANATPLPGTGYPAAAIVHFEVTLESFRREAAAAAGDTDVVIVDGRTGTVIVDSRHSEQIGAALGRPNDHRFERFASSAVPAGTATIDGRHAAFQRLRRSPHNANDWYVFAVNPQPAASLLREVGWAPLGLATAAVILLILAAASLRSSRAALHEAAHSDTLTGLPNRRSLMADLEAACERAPKGDRIGVVLYDLDGFKAYNDNFGHLPGDALLRRLALKLSDAMRDLGTAYRLGGDEFCAVVSVPDAHALSAAARVGKTALTEEGEAFTVTASFGSVLVPDEAQAPSDALTIADMRMYANKQLGRPSPARQATDVLVRVQHERSPLLGPHVSDVAELARAVGARLGLPEPRLHLLYQAAELHDVGKMAIPDAVLGKAGPLSEDEWDMVREHTIVGERMLSAAPALRYVAAIVRASHERFDGNGYPDRLGGDSIPLEARIINAADALCAMTTDRPYRSARSLENAVDELRHCSGSQFDPTVVDVLVELLAALEAEGPSEEGVRRAS
jgi:diguanylate cyclase (GGDEF)-like protein